MNKILFSKLITNKLALKNRLVMPPMQTQYCTEEGYITDQVLKYYSDRTKLGKIGLVIVEHSFVSPEGRACERQVSISSDKDIAGLKRLSDIIKNNGSKSCIQISHAGGSAFLKGTDFSPLGPSEVKCIRTGVIPREMTTAEIKAVIDSFAQSAARAKTAGFDAVELHSAHGYLLNQFLSPYSNKRIDDYGGTLENRIRIHLEIIQAVRKEVGENYPILLRLGAKDYYVNGTTLEDGIRAAKLFETYGVDILDISGGMSIWKNPNDSGPGFFKELSKPIKEKTNIPVILTGGITTAEDAENLLQEKAADLIGVGRAIFQNADWVEQEMSEFTFDNQIF